MALAVATIAAGCLLNTLGQPGSPTSGGGMAPGTGGVDGTRATTGSISSGSDMDAGSDVDIPDAPLDACDGTQLGPEEAQAFPSIQAKTIDGNTDDWGCEAPLILDATTAKHKFGPDGGVFAVSTQVRLEWDGGSAPLGGDYGALDHHYIIDYKGLSMESSPPRPISSPPLFLDYSVKARAGGYIVRCLRGVLL
ncbi:MAG: hypothetical protein ACMG6S_10525 [Byssovorax sp.]